MPAWSRYGGPVALWVMTVLLLWGCSGPGIKKTARRGDHMPGDIVDLKTGDKLTLENLIERLRSRDVVFIGEYHQHSEQHRNQLSLIKGLWSFSPDLVIGLEVFPRPKQGLLDQWVRGDMAPEAFRERVLKEVLNLETLEVYFPLFQWARKHRVPILALNAPRAVSAHVARNGLDGLAPEQRQGIARDIQVGPEVYKKRVLEALKKHAHTSGLDYFFTAQVVWDETMAETVADYLNSPQGRGRRAVVICGNEHVFRGYGVPDRVRRRLGRSQAVVLCPVIGGGDTFSPEDADYIWLTEPAPERKRRRLGVTLKTDDDGGVVVRSVQPGSEAERVGLSPGDALITLDGRAVKSFMDLHRAAVNGDPGRRHVLTLERQGEIIRVEFYFKEE